MEGKRVDGRGAGWLSRRRLWVWLALAWVVALFLAMVNGVWLLIVAVLTMGLLGMLLESKLTAPAAGSEIAFGWGMDEIPEDPALRARALRRAGDRKLIERAERAGMEEMRPWARVVIVLGQVMGVVLLGWLVWQHLTGDWVTSLVLVAVVLGCVFVVMRIGFLLHPEREWRRDEDGRAREDRMLRSWTPRGIERTQRWMQWQLAALIASCAVPVLAVWLAPRIGVGVPGGLVDLASGLRVYALAFLGLAIIVLVMPLRAELRRQNLAVSYVVLWAPEDGVSEDGAMEGGVA